MDGPGQNYAKCSKAVKERQVSYDFTHVEPNEQTELTSKIERLIESRLTVVWGGAEDWRD